jgi:hypothetical protein
MPGAGILEVGLVEAGDRVADVSRVVDRQVALAVPVDVGERGIPESAPLGAVRVVISVLRWVVPP